MMQVSKPPILLLKIPISTRNTFSKNYRKFGHALCSGNGSPALSYTELDEGSPHSSALFF